MNIYIFLIWLFFLMIFFKKIKKKEIRILLIIVPMFFSLALQTNIGTDYYSYIKIFRYGSIRVEKGYLLLNKFLKFFSTKDRILFVGVSFLQMCLLYKILIEHQKIKLYKNILLYIYIWVLSTSSYILMFNALRTSIAALFFNLCIILSFKKKYILALIILMIGGSFHKSIFIALFIIIIFYKFLKKFYKREYWYIFLILSFFINKFRIIRKIAELLYNSSLNIPYKNYLVSEHMFAYIEGFGIATIINFIIFLLSVHYYKYINKKYVFFYNLGFFTMCLKLIFTGIPVLERILEYFYMFQALVLYFFISNLLKKKYFYFGIGIILFYLLKMIIGVERMLKFNEILTL